MPGKQENIPYHEVFKKRLKFKINFLGSNFHAQSTICYTLYTAGLRINVLTLSLAGRGKTLIF